MLLLRVVKGFTKLIRIALTSVRAMLAVIALTCASARAMTIPTAEELAAPVDDAAIAEDINRADSYLWVLMLKDRLQLTELGKDFASPPELGAADSSFDRGIDVPNLHRSEFMEEAYGWTDPTSARHANILNVKLTLKGWEDSGDERDLKDLLGMGISGNDGAGDDRLKQFVLPAGRIDTVYLEGRGAGEVDAALFYDVRRVLFEAREQLAEVRDDVMDSPWMSFAAAAPRGSSGYAAYEPHSEGVARRAPQEPTDELVEKIIAEIDSLIADIRQNRWVIVAVLAVLALTPLLRRQ